MSRRLASLVCSTALAAPVAAPAASVTVDFGQVVGVQPMTWGTNEMPAHIRDSNVAPTRLAEINSRWCRYWVGRDICPDHQGDWHWSYLDEGISRIVQGGAKPMVCFAGVPDWMAEPYDHPDKPSTWNHPQDMNVWGQYCVDIVQHCESLGYPVENWTWEIWNEPNNGSVSGGWSTEEYLELYDAAAAALRAAYPDILIGGPSTDHPSENWIIPLLADPDRPVNFVTWHRYGAWDPGFSKPTSEYLAETYVYGTEAAKVENWININRPGEGIWNVCGELNLNAYCCPIEDRIWEDMMIPWYASVMRHLLLNGCDIEQFFVGTDKSWPNYGLFLGTGDDAGLRSLAFFAKRLFSAAAGAGGQLVWTQVSGSSTLEVLAAHRDQLLDTVILINKTTASTPVTLTISGPVVAGGVWYTIDQASYDAGGIDVALAPSGSVQSTTLDGYVMKVFEICEGAPSCDEDRDDDGLLNLFDNCPDVANVSQADADQDGVGDACDVCPYDPANDVDGDEVCGNEDNCPSVANPDQADEDGDAVGDACDACPNTLAGLEVDEAGCPPYVPGDLDRDGDVDQEDFGHFQVCMSGEGIQAGSDCLAACLDDGDDVDGGDLEIFLQCKSGANIPADPQCGP